MELAGYIRSKTKIGACGAEMVEYAIVLACIAAVGVFFYAQSQVNVGGTSYHKLPRVLGTIWEGVKNIVDKI